MSDSQSYRDRIYIIKDIIMKLVEYGELNQTALVSFCGLNLKKHRAIFEKMELNGFIAKSEIALGKRVITVFKPTEKGLMRNCFQGTLVQHRNDKIASKNFCVIIICGSTQDLQLTQNSRQSRCLFFLFHAGTRHNVYSMNQSYGTALFQRISISMIFQ